MPQLLTTQLTVIELALYNLILTSVSAVIPQPFVTTSRRPNVFGNVDPSQQPWFALCPLKGTFNNGEAPGLTVLTTRYFVQILMRADFVPYDPQTQQAPQDLLNAGLYAVMAAVFLPGGQKQTLGGLVVETLLEDYTMDSGILDAQTALELIMSTKVGINGN